VETTEIHDDDLIGAVKWRGKWRLFATTLAHYILDYVSYDPSYDPGKSSIVFRDRLLRVDESNVERYLRAMSAFELEPRELGEFLLREGPPNWPLSFAIDFDAKHYVNGFSEIPVHEYVPARWTGEEGEPLRFVDEKIRSLWPAT
jgi:hypothetical protein